MSRMKMKPLKHAQILTIVVLIVISTAHRVEPLARLVKVPLQRSTTQHVGSLGQPVISYHAQLAIGTPPVMFEVGFETGFNGLFVPHYSWNPFNTYLHYKKGFQCKSSSTCHKDEFIHVTEYQNCRLTGKRYLDNMLLTKVYLDSGNLTHVMAHNLTQYNQAAGWRQDFLAISSASNGRFSELPLDGFVGLGPMVLSPNSLTNLLVGLRNAKLIDNLQFSFAFNPVIDSQQGGELTLGGVDPTRYQGPIYWHPLSVQPAFSWQVRLQQVKVGEQIVGCSPPGDACEATFSTALSDTYGPRKQVESIYAILNTSSQSSGLQLIDCRRIGSLPHITFNIDGIPYWLLPSNYIRKTVDGKIFKTETCYVSILPQTNSSSGQLWTLGTNFLGAYYSVYDMDHSQVGFASLR